MNRRADHDLVVVGGGILGAALAYRAAQMFPERRIALYDRGAVGSGCSGFAGAIATPAVRSELVHALSAVSREWYAAYRRQYDDAPMRELPITYIVADDDANELTARLRPAEISDGRGCQPNWLKVSSSEQVLVGANAVWADVRALCTHLVSKAGVAVYEGTMVDRYRRCGEGWELELADGRSCQTHLLALAKGAWFGRTERSLLAPLRNKKVVAFVLDMPANCDESIVYFHNSEAFLLPLPTRGQWLLSVVSMHWDCDPEAGSLQASAADLKAATNVLERYAPALLPILRGARVHCDGYLDGHRPRSQDVDGVVCMYGGSGSGFRYAPAIAGEALTDLARIHSTQAPGVKRHHGAHTDSVS